MDVWPLKIAAFYTKYNPGEMQKIAIIIKSGKPESAVLPALFTKYNVSPDDMSYWNLWQPEGLEDRSIGSKAQRLDDLQCAVVRMSTELGQVVRMVSDCAKEVRVAKLEADVARLSDRITEQNEFMARQAEIAQARDANIQTLLRRLLQGACSEATTTTTGLEDRQDSY